LLHFVAGTIQVTEGRMLVSPGLEEQKKLELIFKINRNRILVGKA